jgi:hypothetical protein
MVPKLPVLISVDVECAGLSNKVSKPDLHAGLRSLDCVVNGRPLGLPFIVETLDNHGLKGTFFVDPFSIAYFGEEKLDAVLDLIRAGGHDVQLHIHPSWHWLSQGEDRYDSLYRYGSAEQSELIGLGVEAFRKRGIFPTAFRAGTFAADNATYGALKEHGFTVSSSYNLSALDESCKIEIEGVRNDAFAIEGLMEIPITNYLIRDLRHGLRYAHKPFQVACTSFPTAKRILESARSDRYTCVNLVLHNFEFVDRRHPDWLSRPMSMLGNTVNAFRDLCGHLAANPESYRTITFTEMEATLKEAIKRSETRPARPLPKINRLHLPLELFSGSDPDGLKPVNPSSKAVSTRPWYLGGKVRDYSLMSFISIIEQLQSLLPLTAAHI